MMGFPLIPNIFFPPSDRALITADLELPLGTPIERTEQIVTQLERYIDETYAVGPEEDEEGAVNWTVFVGEGAPQYVLTYSPEQPSPEYAYIMINTTSRTEKLRL